MKNNKENKTNGYRKNIYYSEVWALLGAIIIISIGIMILISLTNKNLSHHYKVKTSGTTTAYYNTEKVVDSTLYSSAMYAVMNNIFPVCTSLYSINKSANTKCDTTIGNIKYVLMATLKSDASFYHADANGNYYTDKYEIWMFSPCELKNKWKEVCDGCNAPKRLKQLLGLPANGNYRYFSEFWVPMDSLFRPCRDSEINDNTCQIDYPVKNEPSHKTWMNKTFSERHYKNTLYENYPFTGMGFTYDYSPESNHIGLSEFIIKSNRIIKFRKNYLIQDFLKKRLNELN